MFTAYVLHARAKPFLPRASISKTLLELAEHERKAAEIHGRSRRQSLIKIGEQLHQQRSHTYVVDYNTLEAAFLVCSMLLLLSGMVFSSAHWKQGSLQYDMLTYVVLIAIIISSVSFLVILVVETARALKFARVQARARRLEVELAERMIAEAGSSSGKVAKMLGGRGRSMRGARLQGGTDAAKKSSQPRAQRKPHLTLQAAGDPAKDVAATVSPRTMSKLVTEFATGEPVLSPPAREGKDTSWTDNPMKLSAAGTSARGASVAGVRRATRRHTLSPGSKVAGKVVPPPSKPPPAQLLRRRDQRRSLTSKGAKSPRGAKSPKGRSPTSKGGKSPKSRSPIAAGGWSPRSLRLRKLETGKTKGRGSKKTLREVARKVATEKADSPRARLLGLRPGVVLDMSRRRASMMRSAKLAAPPGVRQVRPPRRELKPSGDTAGARGAATLSGGDATDWRKVFDEDSQLSFWYSEALGESVWIAADDANPLPPNERGVDDWERHDDEDDGKPFWYSASREYSVWSDPKRNVHRGEGGATASGATSGTADGVDDWERHYDTDVGLPFWYSPSRSESIWTNPRGDADDAADSTSDGSGDDWQEVWDEDVGRMFWYSESRGESVWEDPTVSARDNHAARSAGETAVATDWVEHEVPDGSGRRYWYSPSLDLSRWTDPNAAAP